MDSQGKMHQHNDSYQAFYQKNYQCADCREELVDEKTA
jgi:hypothetical protein